MRLITREQVNPPDFFSSAHLREKGPSGTILRFLHYPSVAGAQGTAESVRAGAHSDYGSLTVSPRSYRSITKPDRIFPIGARHSHAVVGDRSQNLTGTK